MQHYWKEKNKSKIYKKIFFPKQRRRQNIDHYRVEQSHWI